MCCAGTAPSGRLAPPLLGLLTLHQRLQAQDQPAQARPAPSPLRLYYKEAERQLTAGLGRRVTITQGKKKGKIALEYYDQEDLEGLMQALSALDTGKERRKP